MRQKKIVSWAVLIISIISISGLSYWLWSRNNCLKTLAWVEENGGSMEFRTHPLVENSPRSFQFLIEKFTGKEVVSVFFANYPEIEKIDKLKNISTIEYLVLYGESIRDISAISYLTSLKNLKINDTSISDISEFKHLVELSTLNIYDSEITDLGPIGNLAKLNDITLHGKSFSDISELRHLPSLKRLGLLETSVKDLMPLKHTTNLKALSIVNVGIPQKEIDRLSDQVEALKKHLPTCEIYLQTGKAAFK